MKLGNKRVAIIGGGPGGLILARLLQLKGVNAHVYERDLNRNARLIGSPLDMHKESGMAALRKADLLEAFKNNFPQTWFFSTDLIGKLIRKFKFHTQFFLKCGGRFANRIFIK